MDVGYGWGLLFFAANLVLARFPLTNGLGENMPACHKNMFNLRLCNAATIRYSLLKFGHMHLCGIDYKYFSPHCYCYKCNSLGCTAPKRHCIACNGPHGNNVYSGSEHNQFDSPRPVKREACFPNPRQVLIGSNRLWHVNDFLPEASFGLRVLSLPASVCVCVCVSVCLSVCVSITCLSGR